MTTGILQRILGRETDDNNVEPAAAIGSGDNEDSGDRNELKEMAELGDLTSSPETHQNNRDPKAGSGIGNPGGENPGAALQQSIPQQPARGQDSVDLTKGSRRGWPAAGKVTGAGSPCGNCRPSEFPCCGDFGKAAHK